MYTTPMRMRKIDRRKGEKVMKKELIQLIQKRQRLIEECIADSRKVGAEDQVKLLAARHDELQKVLDYVKTQK